MIEESKQLSDIELIQKILSGEKVLYEIIVRRYNPYLYKVGRSYNYNHPDTEGLMQETFIDAYKNLDKFEGRSSFKTWITRIMLNNCYQKLRKSRTRNEITREIRENSKPMFMDNRKSTANVVRSHELQHIIEEALLNIPLKYRMVFSLREINGMNVEETARLLEISEANVKTRLSRAKKMLRDNLERVYSKIELFEFNLIHCNPMVNRVMNDVHRL